MRIIRAPTIARAHELVVKMILEKGVPIGTEDGEATIEGDTIAIRVENPFTAPMVSPASRFQMRFMEEYARSLLHGSDSVFEYDYHGRLFNWGERLIGGGEDLHIDQIEYIIQKLREAPLSRRAMAITWNPFIDERLNECPCLQLLQCNIREGKLHMKVVFRSNDMLTASGANMFALVHLQKLIADRLNIPCGSYTHIALVPHIYYRRDVTDIPPFCHEGEEIQPIPAVCEACGRCG
ncbi:MAG: thymidylate synthase [Methanoregulaceae archaeon]|nr:thymidylate synthase [Methanoregulaceae archaeon]